MNFLYRQHLHFNLSSSSLISENLKFIPHENWNRYRKAFPRKFHFHDLRRRIYHTRHYVNNCGSKQVSTVSNIFIQVDQTLFEHALKNVCMPTIKEIEYFASYFSPKILGRPYKNNFPSRRMKLKAENEKQQQNNRPYWLFHSNRKACWIVWFRKKIPISVIQQLDSKKISAKTLFKRSQDK